MNTIKIILITFLTFGFPAEASAQTKADRQALSNGGDRDSYNNVSAHGAIGQIIAGRSAYANQLATTQQDSLLYSQLPIIAGAGVAKIWNDNVYFIGGATHWWGQTFHQSILTLHDGQWLPTDTIPDGHTWGMIQTQTDSSIYLMDGWSGGAGLLRRYDFTSQTWHYLATSTNWVHWGSTAEIVDEHIYLFNPAGHVYEYSINAGSWTEKLRHFNLGFSGMRSVMYNDEIYIVGFRDGGFYKYTPASDSWTRLADPPYLVAGCAVQLYRGKMFCVGGSPTGGPGLNRFMYRSVISYDFANNSWEVEPLGISDGRTFMASVVYDDELYVFGGFDSLALAVQTVEKLQPRSLVGIEDELNVVIPERLELENNYPNPFNPATTIRFGLPAAAETRLEIFNMLGKRVRVLVNAPLPAGRHSYVWDGHSDGGQRVASGIYLYRLTGRDRVITKKLMLLK